MCTNRVISIAVPPAIPSNDLPAVLVLLRDFRIIRISFPQTAARGDSSCVTALEASSRQKTWDLNGGSLSNPFVRRDHVISHSLRCVYIHVPKTGGHSIDRHFLAQKAVSEPFWHATASDVRARLGDELFSQYYSFATVRNPWDRFVSEYVWQSSRFSSQIPTPWGNKDISFEDFCRSDCAWYPEQERADGHLDDQAHFVFDDADRLLVNRIVRFERLATEFSEVCRELGLADIPLRRLNSTEHPPYWRYYSADLAELIGQRFARDIRLFGYRFGD